MRHDIIWGAVDNLAKKNKISASGMAKIVGLDATTFNKSKRYRPDGKKRWPSLQSINKLLDYFEISFDEFVGQNYFSNFFGLEIADYSKINLSKNNMASVDGFDNWQKMGVESVEDIDFAILLDTQKYEPLYKFNSTIIISKNSDIRKGDRVFLINRFNEICLYEFVSLKAGYYELLSLENRDIKEAVKTNDILLLRRIVWASQ